MQNRKFHLSFLSSELPLTITSGQWFYQATNKTCALFLLRQAPRMADSVSLTTVA